MSSHVAPSPSLRLVSPSTDEPKAHRVSVRYCAGYDCKKPVTTHRVKQNIHGHREYCGLVCYARWSPGMRLVIAKYPDYDQSPMGLESLINDLKADQGVLGAATTLGISRSTVTYWLRKCSTFRQFAGQTPDQILHSLAHIAEEQGMKYAAKIIVVDPKTLQRAIDKLHGQEAA